MKIRKYIPAIVIFSLMVIMAITNPSESSFRAFATKQLMQHGFTEKDLETKLACEAGHNYIIFTRYAFTIDDSGVPIQGRYLGIFGCFFSISGYTSDGSQ